MWSGIKDGVPWVIPLTYGETGRTLATRMKDHLNPGNTLTAVGEHCAHEYQKITQGSVKVLAREDIYFGWREKWEMSSKLE